MSRKESAIILVQQAINDAMKPCVIIKYSKDKDAAYVHVELANIKTSEEAIYHGYVNIVDNGPCGYPKSQRVTNIFEKYKIASNRRISINFGSHDSCISGLIDKGVYLLFLGIIRGLQISEDTYCELLDYLLSCNTRPVQHEVFFTKN
jgi:hypothetical protein